MKLRIFFGKRLIRLGAFMMRLGHFINTSAVAVMSVSDLIECSHQSYMSARRIKRWGDNVEDGLSPHEKVLINKIPKKSGELLMLCLGGGREAIQLAKLGYHITGVDFVPEMIEKAKANAKLHGINIEVLTQEISELKVQPEYYDIAWLGVAMYSAVPTREKRVEMLKKIRNSLKPGGIFMCEFFWIKEKKKSESASIIKKIIASISLGNLQHQKGDIFYKGNEFIHIFSSEEEVKSEFVDGGFIVEFLGFFDEIERGASILKHE